MARHAGAGEGGKRRAVFTTGMKDLCGGGGERGDELEIKIKSTICVGGRRKGGKGKDDWV